MPSGLILSEGKPLPAPPSGREWATSQTANVGVDRLNPGIKVLALQSVHGLLRRWMSG